MTTTQVEPDVHSTEPEVKLTRLEEIEVQVAQEMASDFTMIGKLFATDPAKAALEQQQLFNKVRANAKTKYDSEVTAAVDKRLKLQGLLDAFKEQALKDFGTFWAGLDTNAKTLPFVSRWGFQVDMDPEQSIDGMVVYKAPTIIHAEVTKAGLPRVGAPRSGGSHTVTVDGSPYASGAEALRKLHPDVEIKPGVNALRELRAKKHNVEVIAATS